MKVIKAYVKLKDQELPIEIDDSHIEFKSGWIVIYRGDDVTAYPSDAVEKVSTVMFDELAATIERDMKAEAEGKMPLIAGGAGDWL